MRFRSQYRFHAYKLRDLHVAAIFLRSMPIKAWGRYVSVRVSGLPFVFASALSKYPHICSLTVLQVMQIGSYVSLTKTPLSEVMSQLFFVSFWLRSSVA